MKRGSRLKRALPKLDQFGRRLRQLLHRSGKWFAAPNLLVSTPKFPVDRSSFTLEALERRILMSADISYSAMLYSNVILQAAGGGVINLVNTSNSALIATATITNGATNFTVQGTGGSWLNPVPSDTIHINVASFANLNGVIGAGNTLQLNFNGDGQYSDPSQVDFDGAASGAPATLTFGLSVNTPASIAITGATVLGGDTTLTSSQSTSGWANGGIDANASTSITMANASLTDAGHALTLTASSNPTVNDSGIGDGTLVTLGSPAYVITSAADASVSVTGSTISAATVNISAAVNGSLVGTVENWPVKIVVIVGEAHSTVTVDSSDITATGADIAASGEAPATSALSLAATTDMTISATAVPGVVGAVLNTAAATYLSGAGYPTPDAADVTVVYDDAAKVAVTGNSVLDATTGSTTIAADQTLVSSAIAGASAAPSGAGLSMALTNISGDTIAHVDNSDVAGLHGVSILSDTSRTLTTTAISSPGGGSTSGNDVANSVGDQALAAYGASTSAGSVSAAGAVAVGTNVGLTEAYINNATLKTGEVTGETVADPEDVKIIAASLDKSAVTADGSTVTAGATGIGVGVAIDINLRQDLAYITGNSNVIYAKALDLAVEPLNETPSSFTAEAISGAGAPSQVSVAGSLAINVTNWKHQAYLDAGAGLALYGDTEFVIKSVDDVANLSMAVPANSAIAGNPTGQNIAALVTFLYNTANQIDGTAGSGGSVGIGASIAVNENEDTTAAYIGDGASITGDGAGSLTLDAESGHDMDTQASGGGAGATAVTPIVALSISDDNAYATFGSGTALTVKGDISATSSMRNAVGTSADGDTTGTSVGVGISIAIGILRWPPPGGT